jgi:type II secretory pathway component PulF
MVFCNLNKKSINPNLMELLIPAILIVVAVFIVRLFGACMLRINDVIDLQKEILSELKKINKQ